MHADVLAVLAVAALAGGWVVFQRWVARVDPELPGIKRSCSGCPTPGSAACHEDCNAEGRRASRTPRLVVPSAVEGPGPGPKTTGW
jgi:hypothetical protein